MKNNLGLLDSDIQEIINVLSQFSYIDKAVIFGSRAKGNFKQGSDVDIAVYGSKLNLETIHKISFQLNEETNMPYKFDTIHYNNIQDLKVIDHINRVGIEIYVK